MDTKRSPIKLEDLTLDDYCKLKSMGFLWEFYPQATGNWYKDTNNKKG